MDATFDLRYELTEAEFLEAFRLHLLGHYARPSSVLLLAAAITLIAAQWRAAPGKQGTYGLIVAVVFLIGFRVYTYWRLPRVRLKRSEGAREAHEVLVRGAGVHLKTSRIDTEIPWKDFRAVRETHDLFILYKGKNSYLPIPKRAVGDEARVAELRALTQAHLKQT